MPKKVISGNYAAAYAAKHARVEVVAAYPITPQTWCISNWSKDFHSYISPRSRFNARDASLGRWSKTSRSYG